MNYAIIGAGAIGAFYGAKLAKSGREVHFLFHSDYQEVKENGLNVKSVDGDFHLPKINAYDNVEKMPKCDIILVCLKTTANALLEKLLPPILKENSCVILIQNGLGIEKSVAEKFPNITVGGGLAFICSHKIGAGKVHHLDYGKITIGGLCGEKEVLQQICADFQNAGVEGEFAPDLNLARWKKLVWNVPFNGMSVVLKATTEEMMKNPSTRALIRDLMLEVRRGAAACGAEIPEKFIDEMMIYTDNMRPYLPSMRLDFDFKREMEIGAIYRNTISAAKENGVNLPKIEMLCQQLEFIQVENLK